MLNALGIDRAIHVAAKWTLMYYKVPVGAAQTKLFSLLPIHQPREYNLLREEKKSWFLNWAKLQCHDREGAQVRLSLVEWNVVLNSWELFRTPIPTTTKPGVYLRGTHPKQSHWVQIFITQAPLAQTATFYFTESWCRLNFARICRLLWCLIHHYSIPDNRFFAFHWRKDLTSYQRPVQEYRAPACTISLTSRLNLPPL